jgi:Tol biopolymer transport system component
MQRIAILSMTGEVLQRFTVKNWNAGMDWAADGKGLFVSTSAPRGSAMTHVDLQGNARVTWQQQGDLFDFGVPTPDGRHLAIASGMLNSNIWMLENF